MSLTKLFNKDYAIQNIKKSKSVLVLMLIIVPLVTLFSVYITDKTGYSYNPIKIGEYVWPTIVGIAIIPLLLSIVLLGYVYKKNKVDFINAMPIERKTIFMTNMILGIVFILLFQLLTLGINGLYLVFNPDSFFVFEMMLDVFVVMLISYIYVYSACVLALSFSGNIMTQIVITMLLIFLPPCIIGSVDIVKAAKQNEPYLIIEQNSVAQSFPTRDEYYVLNYNVMPISLVINILEGDKFIEAKDITITLIATLINIALGLYLFDNRKMENNGTSFETKKAHILVKGLTLYPMSYGLMTYIVSAEEDFNFAIFAFLVFIIFMYYLIYDFITGKKIKFKISLLTFVLIFGTMTGILTLYYKSIDVENVATERIRVDRNNISYICLDNLEYSSSLNRKIKIIDKELVNLILDNMVPENIYNDIDIHYNETSKIDYNNRIKIIIPDGDKEYKLRIALPVGMNDKIYEKIKTMDEKIVKYEGEIIDKEIVYYIENSSSSDTSRIKASKNSEIVKEINNEILNTSAKYQFGIRDYYGSSNYIENEKEDVMFSEENIGRFEEFLNVYFYKDGKSYKYKLNTKNLSDEIRNEIYNNINQKNAKLLSKKIKEGDSEILIENYEVPRTNLEYKDTYYDKKNNPKLVEYMIENALEKIDINGKVVRFRLSTTKNYTRYTIYVQLDDKFKEKFPNVYDDIMNQRSSYHNMYDEMYKETTEVVELEENLNNVIK